MAAKRKDWGPYTVLQNNMGWTDAQIATALGYGGNDPVQSMRSSSKYKSGEVQAMIHRLMSLPGVVLMTPQSAQQVAKERMERVTAVKREHIENTFTPEAAPDDGDEW